jgi:hypothetical protein
MSIARANSPGNSFQFNLLSLFEYTTICCIVASLTSLVGIPSALCLMGFALGLFLRQGWLAVALLTAAFIASISTSGAGFFREFAIIFVASLICLWYIYRRRDLSPAF